MIKINPIPMRNPNAPIFYQDKFYCHQVENVKKSFKKILKVAVGSSGAPVPPNNSKKFTPEQLEKLKGYSKANLATTQDYLKNFNLFKNFKNNEI